MPTVMLAVFSLCLCLLAATLTIPLQGAHKCVWVAGTLIHLSQLAITHILMLVLLSNRR